MGPLTGGMMEGLLVFNSPFLGDCLDPLLGITAVGHPTFTAIFGRKSTSFGCENRLETFYFVSYGIHISDSMRST